MVLRKKNLLDAFRQAAPEGRKAAPPSAQSSSGAGGPFAPQAPGAPRASEPAPKIRFEPAPSVSEPIDTEVKLPPSAIERLLADRTVRAAVLVLALIGIGAYFVSRFAATPTLAADQETSGNDAGKGALGTGLAAGADLVEKNQAAARMGTAVDKAFMDPANRFTIRLIQYNNDEAGQKRARETAEFLKKQAIPVVSPISLGKHVVLAADAKARTEDLAGLLKHLKTLAGPPPQEKQTPFSSAYVVNIDDLVKRR
jgi:hypothetical protein